MLDRLYVFGAGTGFALALAVCVLGSLWRVVSLYRLARLKDAALFVDFQPAWAAKSVLAMILPWSITWREERRVMTLSMAMHACFLLTALFASGHAVLLQAKTGIDWWGFSVAASDAWGVCAFALLLYFGYRRLTAPEVRALTNRADWLAFALAFVPLATGLFARWQLGPPQLAATVHVLSGDLLLVLLPFTKLSHAFLFVLSRAVTGSDFGKRGVGAW